MLISGNSPFEDLRYVFEVVIGQSNIDDPFFQVTPLIHSISYLSNLSLEFFLSNLRFLIVIK